MSKLILVRHSFPETVPALPANRWSLSEEGRRRCEPLADMLAAYGLDRLVTSTEPKAVQTGQIVAQRLDKPWEMVSGLHEHDRRNVQFGSQEQFQASVAGFFAAPDQRVFGLETADQAHQRFVAALEGVMEQYAGQNVAVVTHGTVMTLFVARAVGLDPFPLWQRLGLPAFIALSWPEIDLLRVVEEVA